MRWSSTAVAGAIGAVLWCAGAVQAATVTVVTSLSQEMVEAYRQAFARQYPKIHLDVVAKSASHLLPYVEGLPADQRPDVVWSSSPDTLAVLARRGFFQATPDVRNPQVPDYLGRVQLNQPQGLYWGQSLAGYGIMWNTETLRQRQLPAPAQWGDLTSPVYHGKLALSAPARSGTTRVMVESILQGEGWDKGWATLLQIAGNAAEIAPDSYAVPRGVAQGRYALGLVIDAFGLAAKYSGQPVEFVYPTMTAVLPVSIGLVKGARNAADARRFMAFTLSNAGQQLLLEHQVNRLPVLPLGGLQVPAGYPDPYEVVQRSQLNFDVELASQRLALVNLLFDQQITRAFKELKAVTRAIQQADAAWQQHPEGKAKILLRQARQAAYTPVLSAKALSAMRQQAREAPGEDLLLVWQQKVRHNYQQALRWAQQAQAMAKQR